MDIEALCGREFEQIAVLRDPDAGLLAFVVIHDTRLGPAFGGIRRWAYASPSAALEDAMQLAAAMTLKCAISGVDGGGAKAVIVDRPELAREAAYRAIGRCVAELGGRYYTGPDVGTTAADLDVVATETEHGRGRRSGTRAQPQPRSRLPPWARPTARSGSLPPPDPVGRPR